MKTLDSAAPVASEVATPRARFYARVMAFADRLPRPLRRITLAFGVVVGLMLTPLAAFAEDPEPSDGVDSLFTGATSTITGTLIPAVVAIVLVGALFWLGVRWFQKGKNAGNK